MAGNHFIRGGFSLYNGLGDVTDPYANQGSDYVMGSPISITTSIDPNQLNTNPSLLSQLTAPWIMPNTTTMLVLGAFMVLLLTKASSRR